jgi:ArsR family transcriptional regulator, arsenate/arsenite/antimonite-responsive transcriptional repressor
MSIKIFKALSDPTRIAIIKHLGKRDICACEFPALTNKAQPTTSLHLRILKEAGLVTTKRDGKKIIYHLKKRKVLDLIDVGELI